MNDVKPWYESKTLWLHAASAVFVVFELNFGLFKSFLSPEAFAYWTLGINSISAVLRLVTTKAVKL